MEFYPKSRKSRILGILLVLIITLSAVSPLLFGRTPNSNKVIFAVILPQKWLVERIVGNKFKVEAVIGRGVDPHYFDVSPSIVKKIAESEIFFSFGLGDSENVLVQKIRKSFPKVRVFDISEGICKIRLKGGKHTHPHISSHHSPNNYDPHVWLSPLNMKVVASNVFSKVLEIDPDNATYYERNLKEVLLELDKLHKELTDILSQARGKRFLVYHSAFKYLERDYGVIEMSIEREGREPSPRELKKLIEETKKYGIKKILVQPGFSRKSPEVIAREIGGEIIEVDPLDYNYPKNLKKIAAMIKDSCE